MYWIRTSKPKGCLCLAKKDKHNRSIGGYWREFSRLTGPVDGSITYNPEALERPAPGNVLVCCSQPSAGVTLDR